MDEALDILQRAWTEAPLKYDGKFHCLEIPELRPRPVQQPGPPLWRSVISPNSFEECGRLGIPILTARLSVESIKERWQTYHAGLEQGGHDETTQNRLMSQIALWRNVYVADSDAQAEDELSQLLLDTRAHMMHVREAHNPSDFEIDPNMLNPWTNPAISDADALPYTLESGCLYGSPARVKEQVAELHDVGVRHLLCQTGFGDMQHEKNLASMRNFGEKVMPTFTG
tara:strand:- start:12 stop:692 length:681 start_codon:yes stop_codon:yes gene_type:complete